MEVIERMPCTITLLPVPKASTSFYDFDDYERLVTARGSWLVPEEGIEPSRGVNPTGF